MLVVDFDPLKAAPFAASTLSSERFDGDSDTREVLNPVSRTDAMVATLLASATGVFVATHIHWPIVQMEDASMLLRYSQNFARGHGIVWNVGDHPVEGATDFLYMIVVGLVSMVTKANVRTAAALVLFVSQMISVAVLYLGLRRIYGSPMLVAAGFAAMLGMGIGYHYVDTGFSPPFFALFALATWYVGMCCVREKGVTWRRAIGFGVLGLITGMIRPDGVILAGLMLCSTLYGVRAKRSRLVGSFGAILCIFGGAYFLWRWRYFGYPLPNPFYIKHQSSPQMAALKVSSRLVVEMLLPILPLVGFAFRNRAALRQMIVWLITVVPFTAVWMIMSLDNNAFARFEYVVVPISLMAIGGIVTDWWYEFKGERPDAAAAVRMPFGVALVLLFLFAIFYNMHLYKEPYSNRGGQELAMRLKQYAAKNYTMALTEAGDLPFYSEWRAIDAFGLNDANIAHHGGYLTAEYLEENHPEVMLYHETGRYLAPSLFAVEDPLNKNIEVPAGLTDKATANLMVMRQYARSHGYVLAARWGAVYCDYHVFWVKPDFADSDAIVSAIRDYPYYMQVTGQLAYNFQDTPNPTISCVDDR